MTKIPALTKLLETKPVATDPSQFHIPDVVGHYMLVALPEKTEKLGNIYIPDTIAEAERAATVIGHVLSLGPDCYEGTFPNGMKRFPSGPWCKAGDKVVFNRYTGNRIKIKGVEFRVLADDQIIATLSPEAEQEVSGL